MEVKSESKYFEIRRKSIHFLFGVLISFLIYYDLFSFLNWLLVLIAGFAASNMLKGSHKKSWLSQFILSCERKEEKERMPLLGTLTFLLGCLLSFVLFEKIVVISAITTLFFGDSVLAIYGTYFGRIKNPFFNREKHLDATALGIILNSVVIYFVFPLAFFKVFFASFVSISYETFVPFKKFKNGFLRFIFDDNIIIPLLFGAVLSLLI